MDRVQFDILPSSYQDVFCYTILLDFVKILQNIVCVALSLHKSDVTYV